MAYNKRWLLEKLPLTHSWLRSELPLTNSWLRPDTEEFAEANFAMHLVAGCLDWSLSKYFLTSPWCPASLWTPAPSAPPPCPPPPPPKSLRWPSPWWALSLSFCSCTGPRPWWCWPPSFSTVAWHVWDPRRLIRRRRTGARWRLMPGASPSGKWVRVSETTAAAAAAPNCPDNTRNTLARVCTPRIRYTLLQVSDSSAWGKLLENSNFQGVGGGQLGCERCWRGHTAVKGVERQMQALQKGDWHTYWEYSQPCIWLKPKTQL